MPVPKLKKAVKATLPTISDAQVHEHTMEMGQLDDPMQLLVDACCSPGMLEKGAPRVELGEFRLRARLL